jgi:hypothetical protein
VKRHSETQHSDIQDISHLSEAHSRKNLLPTTSVSLETPKSEKASCFDQKREKKFKKSRASALLNSVPVKGNTRSWRVRLVLYRSRLR